MGQKVSKAETEANNRATDLRAGIDPDRRVPCAGCGAGVHPDEAAWGAHCDPYSMFNTGV